MFAFLHLASNFRCTVSKGKFQRNNLSTHHVVRVLSSQLSSATVCFHLLHTFKLFLAYDGRMTLGDLINFSLANFRKFLAEQVDGARRFEEDNVTDIFLIAEHDVNRAIAPLGFSIRRWYAFLGQFTGDRVATFPLEIGSMYTADDLSLSRFDRQFFIFIVPISIAAPEIETRGSIFSTFGHTPLDVLRARFIISLGNCTHDRDDQLTIFLGSINIVIFENDVDAQMIQCAQCENYLYGVLAKATHAFGHNCIDFSFAAVLQHPLILSALKILRTGTYVNVNVI